jgi:tetratricopeptide (TPR) repeat protein
LEIARNIDDPATLAEALGALWLADRRPEAAAERFRLATEMADIARRLGDRALEFRAARASFLSSSEVGDMAGADAALTTCTRLADALGEPVLRWQASYLHINRAWSAGLFNELEGLCEETRRLGELSGQPDHLGHSFGPLGLLRTLQGRPDEAAELEAAVLEQLPGAVAYSAALAWALAEAGRPDEARAIVAQIAQPGFDAMHDDYLRLISVCILARACVRLEEIAYAHELYDLLSPHESVLVVVQTVWFGPVSHDLGLLATAIGRYDEAEGHFARAEEVQERIGARGTLVHTRLEWARMLLRRGRGEDTGRARALLEAARSGAQAAMLPIVEHRIDALLTEIS